MRRAFFALALAAAPVAQERPPNVVLVLADDLGFGDPRCNAAASKIPTPHIDALAAAGVRCTDAHSPSSVCSPTRYGILTGRYAWRGTLQRGVLAPWDPPLLEAERVTLPELLQSAGYATACIGKWHLGWDWPLRDGRQVRDLHAVPLLSRAMRDALEPLLDFAAPLGGGPLAHGFDSYFGDDVPNYPPYAFIENDRLTALPTVRNTAQMFGYDGPMAPGWDLAVVLPTLAQRAGSWLDQHARTAPTEPFFLYLPLTGPHTPIAPSPHFAGKSEAGAYGDYVAEVDHVLGVVLDALDRNELAADTLVVFTSDNGSPQRDGSNMSGDVGAVRERYGHDPSAGFRGLKSDAWEGGHRVPFVVRWPGHTPAGHVCDEPFVLTDLYRTLAHAVGVTVPVDAGEDSFDLWPTLCGARRDTADDAPVRDHLVHHSGEGVFAIRVGRWKLIEGKGSGGFSRFTPADDAPPGQLYDLALDPAETTNRWNDHPDVVQRLRTKLASVRANGRTAPFDATLAALDVGPFVGDVGTTTARIWLRTATPGRVELRIDGRAFVQHTLAADDATTVFDVDGLAPGRAYPFTVVGATARDGVVHTAPPAAAPGSVRIAFASCARDDDGTAGAWRRMAAATPDAVVLLGDTPYIDRTDVDDQRDAYRRFAAFAPMAELFAHTAWYGTWDDHDFGRNDTDGRLPGKAAARRAFAEYHANPTCGGDDGGVYTRFRRGPVEVFVLDTRWFAGTAPSPADPDAPTALGATQWQWLIAALEASTAPVKVLACGMIWNAATRPGKTDHWGTYAAERDALFRFVAAERIRGVVLVGGDIHRSRVVRHDDAGVAGKSLVELITSPMHGSIIATAAVPHPGLEWDAGAPHSFLVLEVTRDADRVRACARFLGVDGVLHERWIDVE